MSFIMSFTMLRNQSINTRLFIKHQKEKKTPIWTVILCLIILSGCSSSPNPKNTLGEQPNFITTTAEKTTIQKTLIAEFALLRGEKVKAFNDYLALAESTKDTALAEKSTRIALSLNDPKRIIEATDLWTRIDPSAYAAYPIRLRFFILEQQTDNISKTILNAYQNSIPLRFLNQVVNFFASSPKYLESVESALNQLPEHLKSQVEIQSAQAHTAYLQGDFQTARKISQSLIDNKQDKTNLESNIYFILALTQKQEGETEKAIQTLEQGLALYPNEYSLISSLIDFELTNGNIPAAKKYYEESKLPPLYQSQLAIHYISLLIQNKQTSIALESLKHIDYLSSGFADRFYFLEANALANENNKEEAIEKLQEVTGQLYNSATEQMTIWLYDLEQANKVNDVIASRFNKQQNIEQILNIMQHHEDNAKPQLSLELANLILQRKPDADPIRYKKALLADSLGQWQTTESELRFLLNKEPENANYLNALGYTLLVRSNKQEEAIKLISLAYEKDPDNPAIVDSLGWGYFLQGDTQKAELLLSKAWEALPEAEIAAHYGEALWTQKKYDKAISIWQQALDGTSINPVLAETLNRLNPSMLD